MFPRQWPTETKQRAEKAMADLESFWARFKNSTQMERKELLPKFVRLSTELASAGLSNDGVLDRLASLQDICKKLSRLQQPANFDEDAQIIFGLGDLSMIRSLLYTLGLVAHDVSAE